MCRCVHALRVWRTIQIAWSLAVQLFCSIAPSFFLKNDILKRRCGWLMMMLFSVVWMSLYATHFESENESESIRVEPWEVCFGRCHCFVSQKVIDDQGYMPHPLKANETFQVPVWRLGAQLPRISPQRRIRGIGFEVASCLCLLPSNQDENFHKTA